MNTKEVSIIITYNGHIPENADIEDIEDQLSSKLEDSFRLHFKQNDEEYEEEYHEPWFEQDKVIIAENGYQIIS